MDNWSNRNQNLPEIADLNPIKNEIWMGWVFVIAEEITEAANETATVSVR
jgi:hypothetical protein